MKYAFKVLLTMSIMTASMVLYVYGQVAIFQVSYDINAKAEILKERNERFRRLKFEIERMKAPGLLESKMKEYDLDLSLPREIRILRVPGAPVLQPEVFADTAHAPLLPGRFDFLGRLIKVAQAKMDH